MGMVTLSLRVITNGSTGPSSVEAQSDATGAGLKLRIQEALGIPEQEQLLSFQNGSRNAAKVALDNDQTLEAQGVQDGAVVTVKNVDQEVLPENSVLRQSISKNGGSSYYYAHANEKELPPEHRYVYGGAPAKLAETDVANATAEPETP